MVFSFAGLWVVLPFISFLTDVRLALCLFCVLEVVASVLGFVWTTLTPSGATFSSFLGIVFKRYPPKCSCGMCFYKKEGVCPLGWGPAWRVSYMQAPSSGLVSSCDYTILHWYLVLSSPGGSESSHILCFLYNFWPNFTYLKIQSCPPWRKL